MLEVGLNSMITTKVSKQKNAVKRVRSLYIFTKQNDRINYLVENGVSLDQVTITIDADGLSAEIVANKDVLDDERLK